jgi:hypothetical protein
LGGLMGQMALLAQVMGVEAVVEVVALGDNVW